MAPAIDFLTRGRRCGHCNSPLQFDPDTDLILIGTGDGESGGIWVRLNWKEFKILSIWARFWADQQAQSDPKQWGWMLRTIDAITHQLKKAMPGQPLTIADDAEIAKKQNPDQEVVARRSDGSEVQLEPTWLNMETTRIEPAIQNETPKQPPTGAET